MTALFHAILPAFIWILAEVSILELVTASAFSVAIHLRCLKVLADRHLCPCPKAGLQKQKQRYYTRSFSRRRFYFSLLLKAKISIGLLVSLEALCLLRPYLFYRSLITSDKDFFFLFVLESLDYRRLFLFFIFLLFQLMGFSLHVLYIILKFCRPTKYEYCNLITRPVLSFFVALDVIRFLRAPSQP